MSARMNVLAMVWGMAWVVGGTDWQDRKTLQPGISTLSLGLGCPANRYNVGPNSTLILETAGLGTGYPGDLKCKSQFYPSGDCSLLLQCDQFHLQDKNKGRCSDFLLVKNHDGQEKYCGQDDRVRSSRNHGSRLMLLLKTNSGRKGLPGLRCTVTCCRERDLSSTQVSLDRTPAPLQQCLARLEQEAPSSCGILGAPSKIVGGQLAARHQYTWLAMLTREADFRAVGGQLDLEGLGLPRDHEAFCGGTLVASRWVLTASHCTLLEDGRLEPSLYRVVLGAWDRNDQQDSFVRVYEVAEQLRHPRYNEATYDSDIALWRLASPADPIHFRPICLPWPDIQLRNPMTVAGWGVTQEGGHDLAGKLQQLNVTVVSKARCVEALKPYPITDNMLCAGGVAGQDACQGDSGGPLMGTYPKTNQVFLAGVVSWGIGCGRKGKYGVYTKVSHYRKWFMSVIKTQ